MTTIYNANTEQVGGWKSIQIGSISEITNCPAIITNDNVWKLVVIPIEDGIDFSPVGESIRISSEGNLTDSGMEYAINASFEIALQDTDIDTYLESFNFKDVFFIAEKHFGQKRFYGSKKFCWQTYYQFILVVGSI